MSNLGMRKLTSMIFNHSLVDIDSPAIKEWRRLNPLSTLVNNPDMGAHKIVVRIMTDRYECFYEVCLRPDGSFYDRAYFYSSTGKMSKVPCLVFNSYHTMFDSVLKVLSGDIHSKQDKSLQFSSHCTGFIGYGESSRFFFTWNARELNQVFFGSRAALNQTLFNAFKTAIAPAIDEEIIGVVVD